MLESIKVEIKPTKPFTGRASSLCYKMMPDLKRNALEAAEVSPKVKKKNN